MGVGGVRVGLENPHDTTQAIGVYMLSNNAIASSALHRRSWGDVHHIHDGQGRAPNHQYIASWAVHTSLAYADGFATSMLAMGDLSIAQLGNLSYIALDSRGGYTSSVDMKSVLFD